MLSNMPKSQKRLREGGATTQTDKTHANLVKLSHYSEEADFGRGQKRIKLRSPIDSSAEGKNRLLAWLQNIHHDASAHGRPEQIILALEAANMAIMALQSYERHTLHPVVESVNIGGIPIDIRSDCRSVVHSALEDGCIVW